MNEPHQHPTIFASIALDRREFATVLAALRLYEDIAFGRVDERPQLIREIASDGDAIAPLNNIEVGALCERINCDPPVSNVARDAAPDMLAALHGLVYACGGSPPDWLRDEFAAAENAIIKAGDRP